MVKEFRRILEERSRYYYAMMPFKSLPRMMVAPLMIEVVFYVNSFFWTDGVSKALPPLTIV